MNHVAKFFPHGHANPGVPFDWTLRAQFTLCGITFRQIDLTPAIGTAFLIAVVALVVQTTG